MCVRTQIHMLGMRRDVQHVKVHALRVLLVCERTQIYMFGTHCDVQHVRVIAVVTSIKQSVRRHIT